jgi:hypothetical protein
VLSQEEARHLERVQSLLDKYEHSRMDSSTQPAMWIALTRHSPFTPNFFAQGVEEGARRSLWSPFDPNRGASVIDSSQMDVGSSKKHARLPSVGGIPHKGAIETRKPALLSGGIIEGLHLKWHKKVSMEKPKAPPVRAEGQRDRA